MTKTEAVVDVVRIITISALLAFGMYSCNSCYRTEVDLRLNRKVEATK